MQKAPLPYDELERLKTLQEYEILDTLPETAFDDLVLMASQICQTPVALISLVDGDRQWFKAKTGTDAAETPRDLAFCAHAILNDAVFSVPDATLDERFKDNPLVTEGPKIRFYAGAPLEAPNGSRIGTICVIDAEAKALSESQEVALKALSRQVVDQLELRSHLKKSLQNIDELNRLQADLISCKDKALQSAQAQANFLANMSHEIRTPLNAIIGMTDLLLEMEMPREQRHYTEIVQNAGSSLLVIINDILDLAKIDSGKLHLEQTDFLISTVIENQIDLLKAKATEKNLQLSVQISPNLPPQLQGDPGRLGQILVNLVGNAIKFTKQGEIKIRVTEIFPSLLPSGQILIRVEVEDSGIGISAEAQARIFQPFIQAEDSTTRKFGGTGLGLSICKHLVESMQGSIGVTSQLGQGAIFWFTASFQVSKKTLALAPSSTSSVKHGGFGPIHILVADDVVTNQVLVLAHLRNLNCTADAVQAMEPKSSLFFGTAPPGLPFSLV
jgi:signal transduction histidine kinase